MAQILVVDDDEGVRSYIAEALELGGYSVLQARDGEEGIKLISTQSFDLVLSDLKMPSVDGMTLLRHAKQLRPDLTVVIITAHGTVNSAVEAMKLGADDFIQKPISSPKQLREIAKKHTRLAAQLQQLPLARPPRARWLVEQTWRAPEMVRTLGLLQKVARTSATVLLRGESGTGKEVAARAVHDMSARADKPMVTINCATLSDDLLASELFGHEKGAFTGAHSRRRGRLEIADGGTVFLDELGELSPQIQAKLLRVIQEHEFERVGGNETLRVDVRWVAATNRDLHAMIEAGTFREDLYHRVAVFPIELPPLRRRRADIDSIVEVILPTITRELEVPDLVLSEDAARELRAYHWPGNVRELLNTLKRAAILSSGPTIDPAHLLFDQPSRPTSASAASKTLADIEFDAIQAALEASDGNRREAAENLGIGLRTLYDKLKRYKDRLD